MNRVEILKDRINFHKEQIKKYEEELKIDLTVEHLLSGQIIESGLLALKTFNKKLGERKMFNKSTHSLKMCVNRMGRTIVCEIASENNPKLKGVGKATCSFDDEFNYNKGIRLAELRAKADFYDCVSKYEESKM